MEWPVGRTVGGETWNRDGATVGGGSWSGSWGLAGAQARTTVGWGHRGLAGSPWPRAALEGGLWEAQQEGRASWQQTGSASGWGSAALRRSCGLQDPGGCAEGVPTGSPGPIGLRSSLCRPSAVHPPRRLPAGAWRGQAQVLGSSWGETGLPGLLPWGRLEMKQADSMTSDDGFRKPSRSVILSHH